MKKTYQKTYEKECNNCHKTIIFTKLEPRACDTYTLSGVTCPNCGCWGQVHEEDLPDMERGVPDVMPELASAVSALRSIRAIVRSYSPGEKFINRICAIDDICTSEIERNEDNVAEPKK